MKWEFAIIGLLTVTSANVCAQPTATPQRSTSDVKPKNGAAVVATQRPYQRQETWYDFLLQQLNPGNKNYSRWVEERRRELIEARIRNPYFLYGLCTTGALLLTATISIKLRIDHRRTMWITAEMLADVYNQDAYSRQVAQEAIERYNRHIERCNRAIESGDGGTTSTANIQIEQLRTELAQVAEERDNSMKERDVAREELRKKSEILAELSLRLEAMTSKSGSENVPHAASVLRGTDAKLIAHINNLQEQLCAERNVSRGLRSGVRRG